MGFFPIYLHVCFSNMGSNIIETIVKTTSNSSKQSSINFLHAHISLRGNLPTSLWETVICKHNTRNEMYFQLNMVRITTILYASNSI